MGGATLRDDRRGIRGDLGTRGSVPLGRLVPNSCSLIAIPPTTNTAMSITAAQEEALAQLQAITNSADVDRDRAILESVDWDLQVCARRSLISARTHLPRPLYPLVPVLLTEGHHSYIRW